ncbi:tRNA pseudouridine(55) synthase TruB [Actinospica sp. MGRD01-02]|uniref:tRNA pseudouridine synthase B n=1 Tax=Actinospica acidithermotolerans TaxID=2828514 RepID=A0A941E5L8_9ACTN|nr:tRNA pseudouridine(55) synthase TruB [Actinospica acidithermotolerans]MBR7824852.1 tRNA pseudouridine(55) synthase TruB [Actinospica acidithermotolerans]
MSRRPKAYADRPAPPDGLVIVDKPQGWTSHDVVGKMRRLVGTRRVGHAGTLDPMATGVLVLGVERATRLLGHLALTRKEYEATVRLGQATITDDAEGEVTEQAAAERVAAVADEAIAAGIAALTGEIMQVPSAVSAIKVDGVRSYARVRSGDEVKLQPRPITIFEFELREIRRTQAGGLIDLDVRVVCSSGTYIRALARDLGEGLGVGGHLTALRRTRVGPYTLAEAESLTDLMALVDAGEQVPVLPIAQAAGAAFPRYDADEDQAKAIAHGGPLPARGLGPGPIAVFAPDGTFLALVEEQGRRCKPIAVFV